MHAKTRHRLRPGLDALEARDVPTFWLSSSWMTLVSPTPTAPPTAVVSPITPTSIKPPTAVAPHPLSSIGDQVVSYVQAHLGQRVGGGECAHLAVEALRASGAKFAWPTSATTDYAWGTKLTTIWGKASGAVYGVPSARFQPGDVIQFTNARFRDGTWASHHTAIVAAVDSNGHVTAIYQQNFNGNRAVTKNGLDLSQLASGYVKVYRPQARPYVAHRYQFTVVNNTGAAVTVVERAGTAWASYRLAKANTAASYQIRAWTTYGGAKPTIVVAGHAIAVDDVGAYEVYNSGSEVGVRKLG
jgi:hypothetical protein